MRVVCVDDERQALDLALTLCRNVPGVDDAVGFTDAREALAWLEGHAADAVILDIEMPVLNGISMAERVKKLHPGIALIFLTGHAQYAVDAISLRASGYLLKPVDQESLTRELKYAMTSRRLREPAHIVANTFGYFDFLVDGESVAFKRTKAKELLAFLIDKRGGGVTRQQAYMDIWESDDYGHSEIKMLDTVIRSLRDTLQEYGVGEIFEMKSGFLRIRPELLDCDLYRLLDGDIAASSAFRGEYLNGYPWAVLNQGIIF